mgnify:FL=1|jgi:hypothetical protein
MKELLLKIGISEPGYFSDSKTYVIDLKDSSQYSKVFSKLDKTDLVEELADSSVSNTSISNVMYTNDEYSMNIIADFDSDEYKLVVHKLD